MLTAQSERSGRKVQAWEARRGDQPFYCFCCRREVTLRRGSTRVAHFAHKPPILCEYGEGESATHRWCKQQIYTRLSESPCVEKCELERDLGTVRPDVSAYIGGVPVAIEVQLSNLSIERLAHRTSEYSRKGIYVLWLPLYTSALNKELYSPRPWELWLHSIYNGRVYYWREGLRIQPVHFREYYVQVSGRTRDYEKLSRRKVPLEGKSVTLTEEFKPSISRNWSSSKQSSPELKLFVDTQPRWYWQDGINMLHRGSAFIR